MPNLTALSTDRPDLGAFRISGRLDRENLSMMAAEMNKLFDRFDSVDLLIVFEDFDWATPGALFDTETWKAEFRSLSKIGHYYLVGAPDWAKTMVENFGKLLPMKTRTFERAEEQAAWHALSEARPRQVPLIRPS